MSIKTFVVVSDAIGIVVIISADVVCVVAWLEFCINIVKVISYEINHHIKWIPKCYCTTVAYIPWHLILHKIDVEILLLGQFGFKGLDQERFVSALIKLFSFNWIYNLMKTKSGWSKFIFVVVF